MSIDQHADRAGEFEPGPTTDRGSLQALIRQARDGSSAALGQLMESCRKYLLLVAHRELDSDLRPKAGASDLVQETFFEAQRDFAQFQGATEQEFFAWLVGIMNHRLLNHMRRFRHARMRDVGREVSLDANSAVMRRELPASEITPSRWAMAEDEERALRAALDRLPDALRRVLELRTWERASFVEIAARMNSSADAVRKQWGRAVRRLQQELRSTDDS